MRYSASNYSVTWKTRLGVVQGHWKWHRSIDHPYTTFYWSPIVNIALSGTVFELLRLRLYASELSICLSVSLSVCRQNAKTRFSQKVSNLELIPSIDECDLSHMGFSKNALLDPYNPRWLRSAILKIDMTSFFSAEGGPISIKFRRLVQNDMSTAVIGWCVETETRCIIPVWRTFGRIQWHVIPEPLITLQGAATWWIHCHDSRATWHFAGCKNSIRQIENRFSPYLIFFCF